MAVTFYNGAAGAMLPTVVRIRRPLGTRGLWYNVSKEDHSQADAVALMNLSRLCLRRCRLKFADSHYGELNRYGMYWLNWADVRRRRN